MRVITKWPHSGQRPFVEGKEYFFDPLILSSAHSSRTKSERIRNEADTLMANCASKTQRSQQEANNRWATKTEKKKYIEQWFERRFPKICSCYGCWLFNSFVSISEHYFLFQAGFSNRRLQLMASGPPNWTWQQHQVNLSKYQIVFVCIAKCFCPRCTILLSKLLTELLLIFNFCAKGILEQQQNINQKNLAIVQISITNF